MLGKMHFKIAVYPSMIRSFPFRPRVLKVSECAKLAAGETWESAGAKLKRTATEIYVHLAYVVIRSFPFVPTRTEGLTIYHWYYQACGVP